MRTLLAVARKDILLTVRYPMNLLSRILEPIGWLIPVYFLGRAFAEGTNASGFAAWTGTGDYISFVIVGWILSAYVFAVMWGMGFSLKTEMDQGVLESNWVAPITPARLLVGRTLASVVITTVTTIAFATMAFALFDVNVVGRFLPAAAFMIPVVIGLYGFGFILAGLVLRLRDTNTLIDVTAFVLTLLSCRDYPVHVLPRAVMVVSLILPLTYGYDGVRALLIGTRPLLPLPIQVLLTTAFMVVMILVGLSALSRLERHTRLQGSLGQH